METKSSSKTKLQTVCSMPKSRTLILLLITLALITIIGYFMLRPAMLSGSCNLPKWGSYYTVVLDCGSTGTRVNVYQWNLGTDGNLPVLLSSYPENVRNGDCQYHCMQTEPGLDKFVGNASGVRASLDPLIRYAKQVVPLNRQHDTPMLVFATAGMRRLSVENAKLILNDVKDVIKRHGFQYRSNWIRVLTGKEEAYYGWVALNYRMGVFRNSSRMQSLGLLDLGGSSLQLVTETYDGSDEDNEHVFRSKIGSFEHRLVAYSLPAFGLNAAFDRTVVMLSHTQALTESTGRKLEVRYPCLGSHFVQNYTCGGCFGRDSSILDDFSSQLEGNELDSVLLVGNPNWWNCKVLAKAAATNSSNSEWSQLTDTSKCTGLPSYDGKKLIAISPSVIRYHALSGFFAVYNMLNLEPRANLTKIWEKGEQVCSRSWDDQMSNSGQYCFRVPYMASLIEDAFCLSDAEIIFGPGDISWTLGVALIEAQHFCITYEFNNGTSMNKVMEMMSSPVIVFIILLGLLLIVYRSQVKLPMPGRKVTAARTCLPSYLSKSG